MKKDTQNIIDAQDIAKCIALREMDRKKKPFTGEEKLSVLVKFSVFHHTNVRNGISKDYDVRKDNEKGLLKVLAKEEGIENSNECHVIYYNSENHDVVVVKKCNRIIDVPLKDIIQFLLYSEDNNSLVSSYLYNIPILDYEVKGIFDNYNVMR